MEQEIKEKLQKLGSKRVSELIDISKKVTNFIINTSSEYNCNVFEMLYLLSLSLSIIDIDIIKDKDNYLDFIYNEVRKEVDKSEKRKEA